MTYDLDIFMVDCLDRTTAGDVTRDGTVNPVDLKTRVTGRLHLRLANVGQMSDVKSSKLSEYLPFIYAPVLSIVFYVSCLVLYFHCEMSFSFVLTINIYSLMYVQICLQCRHGYDLTAVRCVVVRNGIGRSAEEGCGEPGQLSS